MNSKRMIKTENGATVVEFAIILFLLLVFIFGIIELSLLLYNKQIMTNAVREGARAGVVVRLPRLADDEIKAVVRQYAENYLVTFGSDIINDEDIDILPIGRCTTFGCDLIVGISYTYNFLVLDHFGLNSINLKSVSTMKME